MNKEAFKIKLQNLGINQREFGDILGITAQQVTNWNKAGKYPQYVHLYLESASPRSVQIDLFKVNNKESKNINYRK